MSIVKKNEIQEVAKESALECFINKAIENSAKIGKEASQDFLIDSMIDVGVSVLPGIGGIVQNIRLKKETQNLNRLIYELSKRIDEIKQQVNVMNKESSKKSEEAFENIVEYAAEEKQQDKITYMVNGFVNILNLDEAVTNEFVITYYDVLNSLRMVDITVLKFMYDIKYNRMTIDENFENVMNKLGISYDQYESIRVNLERLGLLTKKIENNILEDLKEITDKFELIHKYLESIGDEKKLKRLKKLKTFKYKSSDNYEVSKFGVEFIRFFVEKNNTY